jgi:hypothetical protein
MNLFDLSQGTYTITRTISYPEHPQSKFTTRAEVKANSETEWNTNVSINGSYDGPSDVTSVRDYQANWTTDGKDIRESGSATLVLKSGGSLRQVWESTITFAQEGLRRFPRAGERIEVTVSPFQIDGNKMSYTWEGTVRTQSK